MKLEDYKNQMKDLENRFIADKSALSKSYALLNSPAVVGEFISDHSGTIKIQHITFHIGHSRIPECVYRGPRYTKTGKPFKNGENGAVYQQNIKK